MKCFEDYPPGAQKLILAAEQLVADRGVEGASVREILRRAHQRNNSAIYHHFGSKQSLIEQVFHLRQAEADAARCDWVAELAQPPDDLATVLDALLLPVLRAFQGRRRQTFAKLVLQLVLNNPEDKLFAAATEPKMTRQLNVLLRQKCPHLDDHSFRHRYSLAALYLLESAIYAQTRVEQGTLVSEDDPGFWDGVMRAIVGSLKA